MSLQTYIAALFSLLLAVTSAGAGSMTLMGAGKSGAAGLPLDSISAKIGFSTRKLRTAYAGSAIKVQRLSDNTVQDIGFTSGELDTASLASFCSGTTGIVIIWYDQSGNAADFAPFTALEGPVIYTGGAVKAINGKPAIFWNPSASPVNRLYNSSVTANPVNTIYINSVASLTNTATGNPIGGVGGGGSFTLSTGGAGNNHLEDQKLGSVVIGDSSGTFTYGTAGVFETEYTLSSGAYGFWIDGAASGTGTNAQTFSATYRQLGNSTSSEFTSGLQGEYIELDQVGTFTGKATLQANQKTYWGTP